MTVSFGLKRAVFGLPLALVLLATCCVGGAFGQEGTGWWNLSLGSRPSALTPGEDGVVVAMAANVGDGNADGGLSQVRVEVTLPAGVKPVGCKSGQKTGCGIVASAGESNPGGFGDRGPVVCPKGEVLAQSFVCSFEGSMPPFDVIELLISVHVEEDAVAGEEGTVTVAGGGTPEASYKGVLGVGMPERFGVERYELRPEEEGGELTRQAGAHPFQVSSFVSLNQSGVPEAVALPKSLIGQLPAGLIGNPSPIAKCSLGDFLTIVSGLEDVCGQATVVGVAMVGINELGTLGLKTFAVPIFNLEPSIGEPARFGFYLPGTPVFLDPSVRTGGDYGISLGSTNITQTAALLWFKLTFWGVPGETKHDLQRGIRCLQAARQEENQKCDLLGEPSPAPFLSMPTSCEGPLVTSIEAASWLEPHNVLSTPGAPMQALDGCNRLSFEPSIRTTPDGGDGSTPTGLNVDVHVPQDSVTVAKGLAEANVKNITVTLPEGVAVNPSSGDGLAVCGEGEVGYTGSSNGASLFTSGIPASFCPDASKIATVTIHSPLLPNALTGAVYLAAQDQNPFGSLFAMYIVAQDPVSGTLVKLAGEVSLDPGTGRITTTFTGNPQLAFEDAEIHFFGGQRAPLATPARCGTYTTQAVFAPWTGEPPVSSKDSFQITSGPNGSPCPGAALPFDPSVTGGSISVQSGGFTAFSTTIGRPDGNQNIKRVTFNMPPGLSGILTGVKLCGEPQANLGTCPATSLIGESIVSVGVGPDPYSVKGGKVYLTESYGGGTFGLSIVNPVKAGPIDLAPHLGAIERACDCLVVRAKLQVDPQTAALTVTTDPIPQILAGVPLQIQHVNVLVNRPGFTFNPTDCEPQKIVSTIESWEGAQSTLTVPFQVTNCAALGFKPQFKVSTSGKTSRKTGASLKVKLAYPKAAFGSQANIHSVKVSLPKQLPSNLKTLQQACPHTVFETNPAGCSAGSRVGTARATTPLLPVALEGPAYFVSYGGAKFPELVIVLQGYGVTVQLHGETFIDEHTNITSSTFHTIPDVPVGTFELELPQGPNSALAAPAGLCNITKTVLVKKKLTIRSKNGHTRTITRKTRKTIPAALSMPTLFVAQNGTIFKQNTQIEVQGCQKTKNGKTAKRHAKK